MVHLRLNDPDTSRNGLVNFVSALDRYPNHKDALTRLHQLAAVFKPVMKQHGLTINSLEEYEANPEFAGRNWNAGETIEMVLRTRSGSFLPFGLICGVFAHELAHNVHMNHVPSKHGALTRQLNAECRELRRKGYHGDGFWSGGQRLSDREWVHGEGEVTSDSVPQSLCGGAWKKGSRLKKARLKRRRPNGGEPRKRRARGVPSLHTGAQTSANTERTAGRRRADLPLPGQGSRVDGQNHLPTASAKSDTYKSDPNSTFRKRANASSARDIRAAAAMRRIAAMQQQSVAKSELGDVKNHAHEHKGDEPLMSRAVLPGHTLPSHDDQAEQDSVTESESEIEGESDGCELYESSDEDGVAAPCGSAAVSGSAAVTDKRDGAPTSGNAAPAQPLSHTETDEQRKRRTQQFQRVQQQHSQAGGDADGTASASMPRGKRPQGNSDRPHEDEWSTLVKDSQRDQRLRAFDRQRSPAGPSSTSNVTPKSEASRTAVGASGAGNNDGADDDDDDDDDVIFVEVKKAV